MAQKSAWERRNAAVLRARQLRREPTPAEFGLWLVLRARSGGLKFPRQHPFECCTADFYCPAARLVVEVDGDGHSMGDNPSRDANRDRWLGTMGIRVLRIDAAEVMNDLESAVTAILLAARG